MTHYAITNPEQAAVERLLLASIRPTLPAKPLDDEQLIALHTSQPLPCSDEELLRRLRNNYYNRLALAAQHMAAEAEKAGLGELALDLLGWCVKFKGEVV